MDGKALIQALEEEGLLSNNKFDLVEIGDGNINRVFRITEQSGETYILKCAQKSANISSSIRLNLNRGKNEYAYLKEIGHLVPNRVPTVYGYSNKIHSLVMQDVSPAYTVLQKALLFGKRPAFLARQLADYVAVVGYAFSDFSLSSIKKKALQTRFSNPRLCELTETLVFSEPYHACKNNCFSINSRDFVEREIYSDGEVALSAAKLKYKFMNCPQSLIHGDLHFGSVFVGDRDVMVFDPEFCFFGPIGYDLGNLLAHFILHYVFSSAPYGAEETTQGLWLKQMAVSMMAEFETCFLQQARHCTAYPFHQDGFIRDFLKTVMCDTAGYAGAECIRRVIGLAKVSVFEFENETDKSRYETQALFLGKFFITHSEMFTSSLAFEEQLNKLLG